MNAAPAAEENAPYLLLPYQQRWVADESDVKLSEKSRRVGITWATGAEAVLVAGCETGMDVWYTGYTQELAVEFINDCADWVRKFGKAVDLLVDGNDPEQVDVDFQAGSAPTDADGAPLDVIVSQCLVNDEDRDILVFRIRFASGWRISAMTSAPRNFRGKQGYAIIDEAAFHDNLGELLKAAMAFLMWGGRVAVISTHNGIGNDFAKLVEDVRAGEKPYSLHRTTLDDALEEGLFRRICLMQGREWTPDGEKKWRGDLIRFYGPGADEELFCKPTSDGATYISGALIEARMYDAPVVRLHREKGFELLSEPQRRRDIDDWIRRELAPLMAKLPARPHFLGEDFGRVADLSVFAPVTLEQDLHRRVPFLVELRTIPHNQQWQVLNYILSGLGRRFAHACLDGGGNGSWLAEQALLKFGESRVTVVQLSNRWYVEQMPPFRRALEDGRMSLPLDADVKSDLQSFRLLDGVPKLPKYKAPSEADGLPRHGDAGIALVMAHVASLKGAANNDYRAGNTSPEGRRVQASRGIKRLRGLL